MKRALAVVGIAGAVIAVGALLAWLFLDSLARLALQHWGPEMLGVKVQVGEVQLAPAEGRGKVNGIEIGNPPGFSAARAARFGEVRLAVDPSTIRRDVVHVRELAIASPQITYERGERVTNLEAIQRNIDAYVRGGAGDGAAGDAARSKRRYVIDRLTIRGARVLMTTKGLSGQGLAFDLPDVELRDVGKRQGGLTAGQVAALVSSTLQQRIAMKVLSNVDALRRGGLEGAIDALRSLVR